MLLYCRNMCKCGKQSFVAITFLDDPRENKVFDVISEKPVNFTTIKNKAGLHQEITSRLLKRLEGKAIIRKKEGLYDLCCNGSKLKIRGG